MKKIVIVILLAVSAAGCTNTSSLPSHIEESLKRQRRYDHGWRAEKRDANIREWMASDPSDEIKARINRGTYSLLGIAYHGTPTYWIPGVSSKTRTTPRTDAEYFGVGVLEAAGDTAETYMSEFNHRMLEMRKGVTLDKYGHSRAHPDFIEHHPAPYPEPRTVQER